MRRQAVYECDGDTHALQKQLSSSNQTPSTTPDILGTCVAGVLTEWRIAMWAFSQRSCRGRQGLAGRHLQRDGMQCLRVQYACGQNAATPVAVTEELGFRRRKGVMIDSAKHATYAA